MISITYSLANINEVASKIVSALKEKVVLIAGGMGTGKTTLIKEICAQLGVLEEVSSPTFALVNEYADQSGEPIYHFDLYRIEEEEEALDFGIEEYFESGQLCLIEWPDRIPNLLPETFGVITIQHNPAGRQLVFNPSCTFETMPNITTI